MERLNALLSSSIERAGDVLRSSFQMPEHSLSAAQLVRYLRGIQTVALATVTGKGEPRVAPTGAMFWRGRFYIPTIPTVAGAARTRHVLARPAVSMTHYSGNGLAVIAHGHVLVLAPGDRDFDALEALQTELSGQSVLDWGEGVYLEVEADVIYTYTREAGRWV